MIILLGSAGAGKSVQSQRLSHDLNYRWISTGMLLRAHSDSSLKSELNKGVLITDQVVIDVLSRAIISYEHPAKVVLDGFPRKESQAGWLVDWASEYGVDIEAVVHLIVSPDVARQRLLRRHREDDTEEVINKRFQEYQTGTMAIVEAFQQRSIPVLEVNADQDIDTVHQEVLTKLQPHLIRG